MNDIIKIANEITNSTNNATNFTNIQSNLPKTEQQVKDEVVEMIYQKHLQAQEWGNKLNQESETNTHKHRHEKNKRNKRAVNGENQIECSFPFIGTDMIYVSFTPEFLERLIYLKASTETIKVDTHLLGSEYNPRRVSFKNLFVDEITSTRVWRDHRLPGWHTPLGDAFWLNWENIINIWNNSDKKHRIKIVFKAYSPIGGNSCGFEFAHILTSDTITYPNKFLDNLQRDFSDWNKEITINLGLINDNNDNDIKNAIKQKYQNLIINDIEFVDKTDYSHFYKCFSTKIKVKNSSENYSHPGTLKLNFTYTTQVKLNEMNDIISNNTNVKQWLAHINDYNKNLPTKIEQLKSYTDSQKWNAKNTEKEIIKTYIRDWSQISTLIEHELKLDELNKNIQGLKTSFDSIKSKVNELDSRVQNLENVSGWNCANIAGITGGIVSVIPVVGTVGGAVATLTSGACAIAGV